MSRIHDALKKAAEEKASADAAAIATDFVELPAKFPRPSAPREVPPGDLRGGSDQSKGQTFHSFEDLSKRCRHSIWKPDPRLNAFDDQGGEKGGAECFRTLRSRLYQIGATRPLKRILVTSSLPAEGKTFVAANLARSISCQPDRRVLLIDADLRVSRLHVAFGAPSTPGLSEYLSGEADDCSVIQNGPDENLWLISGGRQVTNPSELVLSERMKRLLDLASSWFDFVILDSPPAIPVHDPNLLADLCDGTLFVVRAGVTDFEVAARAAAEFEGKNLLGVVLNGVGPEATYGEYYSGSYGSADK
jgi:protein-tyrosine kinase